MSAVLDERVQDRRLLLVERTVTAAKTIWDEDHNDRERVLERLSSLVEAGQKAMVPLVDAYFTVAQRAAGMEAQHAGLNPEEYVALRGVATREVYDRVFGALGGQIQEGADFHTAMEAARSRLEREVRTDLQLTQVRVAQVVASGENEIGGWQRGVVGTCAYCAQEAGKVYSVEDPMPFHQNCRCSVQPVIGGEAEKRVEGVQDDELGLQLDKTEQVPTQPEGELFDGDLDDLEEELVSTEWSNEDGFDVAGAAIQAGYDPDVRLFVLRSDGDLHGVAALRTRADVPDRAMVEDIGTSGDLPGAGTALIRAMAAQAASEGRGLILVAKPGAEGFYRAIGMRLLSSAGRNPIYGWTKDEAAAFARSSG